MRYYSQHTGLLNYSNKVLIYSRYEEGNDSPLQYSCLENPRDRGAWQGRKESDTTEGLNSRKHFQAQTHTVYGSQNTTGKILCGQANRIRQ